MFRLIQPFGIGSRGSGGAAGPTTLISDTFTDTNGTALASHTIAPTNTPATSWTALEQTFDVQNNRAVNESNTVSSVYLDAGVADGTLTVVVNRSGVADMAILFRGVDASNYWIADLQAGGNFRLFNKASGSYNQVATTAVTFTLDTNYTIKVILNGTSIKAYVDDANELSATSAVRQTATLHGLWCSGDTPNPRFDNFIITNATS